MIITYIVMLVHIHPSVVSEKHVDNFILNSSAFIFLL